MDTNNNDIFVCIAENKLTSENQKLRKMMNLFLYYIY